MNIINLTPHTITIYNDDDYIIKEYPPSGYVMRICITHTKHDPVEGVPCISLDYHDAYIVKSSNVKIPIDKWLNDLKIMEPTIFIVSPISLMNFHVPNSLIRVVSPDTEGTSAVRDPRTNKLLGVKRFRCKSAISAQ